MFSSVLTTVQNIVFPPVCEGCQKPLPLSSGRSICGSCEASFRPLPSPNCPLCAQPWPTGGKCPFCDLVKVAYDSVHAAYVYEGPLKNILHAYKFQRRRAVSKILADKLVVFARERFRGESFDAVVAVAPDPVKLADRGFHPPRHMAAAISKALNIPDRSAWLAGRRSRAQAQLSREQRRHNVRGKFYTRGPGGAFSGLSILLVDDILTTGSTVSECAWVLQSAGAARITGLCLARGPWD